MARTHDKITVVFVLKTGGDFNVEHVKSLQRQILANTDHNLDFVCFSDVHIDKTMPTIKFKMGLAGWWNKLEIFRTDEYETERIFYFDLDTVITGCLDKYFSLNFEFCGLRPWNPQNREYGMMASGLMMFRRNNKLKAIFKDKFNPSEYPFGDQQYITQKLVELDKQWVPLQDVTSGIYSFKRECRQKKPNDARIICFHGKPRPWIAKEPWLKDYLL